MERQSLRVNTKPEESGSNIYSYKEEEYLVPLSPTSEIFKTEALSMHIYVFLESEIPIDVSAACHFIRDVLLPIVSLRFANILVEDTKGRKLWKKVETNLEEHLKVPKFPEGLTPEEYSKHFDDYLSKTTKEILPEDKPLWEFHMFTYPTCHAAGMFFFKIDHAIGDGISLMGALFSCFRRADDPSLPLSLPSAASAARNREAAGLMKNVFGGVGSFVFSIFYSLYDFGDGLWRTYIEDDRTPIRSGEAALHPFSVRISTVSLSLRDVKRVKNLLHATVNDVLVGTIFLGVRLYMQEMGGGSKQKTRSTAVVVANIRSTRGYASVQEMNKNDTKVPWGNRFTLLQLPIPNNLWDHDNNALGSVNPLEFVTQAHATMVNKKASFAPSLMAAFAGVMMRLCGGAKAAARIFDGRLKNATLGITNLVGPTEQMSFANHPIKSFYFIPIGAKLTTVSIMSYVQELRIVLAVEEDTVDHKKLGICVEKAFQLILDAASAEGIKIE